MDQILTENTIHCSEKELSKRDQETCNNEVISNGHNKCPRVQTSKGAYEGTPQPRNQIELEAKNCHLNLKHSPY